MCTHTHLFFSISRHAVSVIIPSSSIDLWGMTFDLQALCSIIPFTEHSCKDCVNMDIIERKKNIWAIHATLSRKHSRHLWTVSGPPSGHRTPSRSFLLEIASRCSVNCLKASAHTGVCTRWPQVGCEWHALISGSETAHAHAKKYAALT